MVASLTLSEIRAAADALHGKVVRTPTHLLVNPEIETLLPSTQIVLKLELFQRTGTFKARGALLNVMALSVAQRQRGVTAISAGNHAIAVAFAAASAGISARVVMIGTANPLRVELCRAYGADIIFAADAHVGFALVKQVERDEGRTLIHPFEGRLTALGTATVGLEFMEQVPDLDAVIVPIGGGGLCAGIASCVK
jgi:threonine dehydratase